MASAQEERPAGEQCSAAQHRMQPKHRVQLTVALAWVIKQTEKARIIGAMLTSSHAVEELATVKCCWKIRHTCISSWRWI